MRRRALLVGTALALGSCVKASPPDIDPGLSDVLLTEVHPDVVVPGTSLDLVGRSFVDVDAGLTYLHVSGTLTPRTGEARAVDVELPASFVDAAHLHVAAGADVYGALGGVPGQLAATAYVAIDSAVDHNRHTTPSLPFSIALADVLTAQLDGVTGGDIYLNQDIPVSGSGFLLGGGEGETRAVLAGCYLPQGRPAPCASNGLPVRGVELPVRPAEPWSRSRGLFTFSPTVAGIHPGSFSGTVALKNVRPSGATPASGTRDLDANVLRARITAIHPTAASLGQFVDIRGGGFVGGLPGTVTLVRLVGDFKAEGAPQSAPVDLMILPRFVAGDHVRYVLDEADLLGHLINLRQIAGSFSGTATPILRSGEDQEVGTAAPAQLGLQHVKQVVYLHYDPSYVESLRLYGLRAADQAVRDRVLVVARRDYAGVNVEFRTAAPTDFALFSQVDILGPDLNNLGLFGYDNTPGKDTSNSRLYDHIGGVNATTQEDGSPGYGGVFAEQFLGFSTHPPSAVGRLPITAASFDPIFDPFRPDVGGLSVSPQEIADAPTIGDGAICPAAPNDRPAEIACAVFVLGNLIGTTLTHETGHSLGLANPFGDGFHDVGDLPNRLMEGGADRPFDERAEINGMGPGRFCDTEYTYLQSILPPLPGTDPKVSRPPCN